MVLSKDGGMYAFVYTQEKPGHPLLTEKRLVINQHHSKTHNEIRIRGIWQKRNAVIFYTADIKDIEKKRQSNFQRTATYEEAFFFIWPDGTLLPIPYLTNIYDNDNTIFSHSEKSGKLINTHPIIMGHYPHKIHPRLPLVSSVSYSGPGLSSWGNYVHGHNPYISNRLYVGNVMLEKEYDHYWPAYFHENENKFTYAAQKDLKIYRVTQSYIVIE